MSPLPFDDVAGLAPAPAARHYRRFFHPDDALPYSLNEALQWADDLCCLISATGLAGEIMEDKGRFFRAGRSIEGSIEKEQTGATLAVASLLHVGDDGLARLFRAMLDSLHAHLTHDLPLSWSEDMQPGAGASSASAPAPATGATVPLPRLYTQAELDQAVADAHRAGKVEAAEQILRLANEVHEQNGRRYYTDQEIADMTAAARLAALRDARSYVETFYTSRKAIPYPDTEIEAITRVQEAAARRRSISSYGYGVVNQPGIYYDTVRDVAVLVDLLRDTDAEDAIPAPAAMLWQAGRSIIDDQGERQDPAAFRVGCLLALNALDSTPDALLGDMLRRVVVGLRTNLAGSLPAGTLGGYSVEVQDAAV